eukprot:gene3699-6244_t
MSRIISRDQVLEHAETLFQSYNVDKVTLPSSFVQGKYGMIYLNPDDDQGNLNIYVLSLETGIAAPMIPADKISELAFYDSKTFEDSEEMKLLQERKRSIAKGVTSFIYNSEDDLLCFPLNGKLLAVYNASCPDLVKRNLAVLQVKEGVDFVGAIDIQFCPFTSDLISFVKNGDIYLYRLSTEISAALTTVRRGLPSYVIQEEFDRYTGYWWQISDINDSYFQILYELVDQRDVDSVKLSNCLFDEQQSDFAFPKPGSSNGVVTLNILNIPKNILCKESDGEELRNFSLENRLKEHIPWMEYIVRCGWIPGRNEIWLQALDRLQQRLDLLVIPVSSFASECEISVIRILTERSHRWVTIHDMCKFYTTTNGYPRFSCSKTISETEPRFLPLTSGNWDVLSLDCAPDNAEFVMFTSTMVSPIQKQAYMITMTNSREWITNGAPIQSSYPVHLTKEGFSHQVCFLSLSLFVDIQSNSATPAECFLRPPIYSPPILNVIKSQHGHEVYTQFFAATHEYDSAPRGTLLFVYGGPNVQMVQDAYNAQRYALVRLLTLCGFNVVSIDGRGSSHRGSDFEGALKHAMGTFEVEDQVEALSKLAELQSLDIDLGRVGIFGFSYGNIILNLPAYTRENFSQENCTGGYISLMALAQRPDIFKVAVAGSPVTDWRHYDSAYTERYLSLPESHAHVYDAGSVVAKANLFPDEPGRLLLMHGLIDENVHFKHTATLVQALTECGKPYDLRIYPNERHGIRNGRAKIHSWVEIATFFLDGLSLY